MASSLVSRRLEQRMELDTLRQMKPDEDCESSLAKIIASVTCVLRPSLLPKILTLLRHPHQPRPFQEQ